MYAKVLVAACFFTLNALLNDSFSRCHLIYRGTAEVFFDPSNAVVESELDLGPSVRDDDPFVVRMKSLYPELQIRRIPGLTDK
jgi:hypothetical protein